LARIYGRENGKGGKSSVFSGRNERNDAVPVPPHPASPRAFPSSLSLALALPPTQLQLPRASMLSRSALRTATTARASAAPRLTVSPSLLLPPRDLARIRPSHRASTAASAARLSSTTAQLTQADSPPSRLAAQRPAGCRWPRAHQPGARQLQDALLHRRRPRRPRRRLLHRCLRASPPSSLEPSAARPIPLLTPPPRPPRAHRPPRRLFPPAEDAPYARRQEHAGGDAPQDARGKGRSRTSLSFSRSPFSRSLVVLTRALPPPAGHPRGPARRAGQGRRRPQGPQVEGSPPPSPPVHDSPAPRRPTSRSMVSPRRSTAITALFAVLRRGFLGRAPGGSAQQARAFGRRGRDAREACARSALL